MRNIRSRSLNVREGRTGKIVQVEKVDVFLKEFLKNGGNATQAVTDAFGITNRASASVIASRYLKEAKATARLFLEKKGATYGRLLEIALEKATNSKNTQWWDRLMKIAGYEDFMSKASPGGVNVNILTAENRRDDFRGFIEEGEVTEAIMAEVKEDEIDPELQKLLDGDGEEDEIDQD